MTRRRFNLFADIAMADDKQPTELQRIELQAKFQKEAGENYTVLVLIKRELSLSPSPERLRETKRKKTEVICEVETEYNPPPGRVVVTCPNTGHQVESAGFRENSIKRCCVLLRQECGCGCYHTTV